jgi:hypothetical protein
MTTQTKESLFNSKELNKILPSYLLDEIDKEENKNSNHNSEDDSINFAILKGPLKVN